MIETIVVIVLIIVVGVSVLAFRNRPQKGIESGISSFRRELNALAPESDHGPRAAQPPVDPPRTSGVGVLRPDPDARPEGGAGDEPTRSAGDEPADPSDDTGSEDVGSDDGDD